MTRRTRQVGEMLREELTDIIRTDVKDPRVGFFTITRVDIGPDLRNATAMVSVLGTEQEREDTLEALRSAAGYIRRQLKPRLRMRQVPEVSFVDDRSMEHAQEIASALKELEREREKRPSVATSVEVAK
jgi:ribosome-binding factor A